MSNLSPKMSDSFDESTDDSRYYEVTFRKPNLEYMKPQSLGRYPSKTETQFDFLDEPSPIANDSTPEFDSTVVLPYPPVRKDSKLKQAVKYHKCICWLLSVALAVLLIIGITIGCLFIFGVFKKCEGASYAHSTTATVSEATERPHEETTSRAISNSTSHNETEPHYLNKR